MVRLQLYKVVVALAAWLSVGGVWVMVWQPGTINTPVRNGILSQTPPPPQPPHLSPPATPSLQPLPLPHSSILTPLPPHPPLFPHSPLNSPSTLLHTSLHLNSPVQSHSPGHSPSNSLHSQAPPNSHRSPLLSPSPLHSQTPLLSLRSPFHSSSPPTAPLHHPQAPLRSTKPPSYSQYSPLRSPKSSLHSLKSPNLSQSPKDPKFQSQNLKVYSPKSLYSKHPSPSPLQSHNLSPSSFSSSHHPLPPLTHRGLHKKALSSSSSSSQRVYFQSPSFHHASDNVQGGSQKTASIVLNSDVWTNIQDSNKNNAYDSGERLKQFKPYPNNGDVDSFSDQFLWNTSEYREENSDKYLKKMSEYAAEYSGEVMRKNNEYVEEFSEKDENYEKEEFVSRGKEPPDNSSPKYKAETDHDEYEDDEDEYNDENDTYTGEDGEYADEYEDYDESGDYEEYTGAVFNVTSPDASLLVYNRVPKCASSTMQTILRRLSRRLGFSHWSSLVYNRRLLDEEEQGELLANLTAAVETVPAHSLSYDRHLYYTNFTSLGVYRPTYINVIRDPVERFISSYYYIRSERRLSRVRAQGRPVSPSPSWINRTVDQCVLENIPECSFHLGEEKEMMLTYFCGHEDFCREVGSQKALQVAKRAVSEDYSVVGLVDHMELSLKLMETLVPRYFKGALRIYTNMKRREDKNINSNFQKPQVMPATIRKLSRRLGNDIDFYNFLKQRLFQQRRVFILKKAN